MGVSELRNAVKKAWYESPKDARGDFSFIDIAFWQETEAAFVRLLNELQSAFDTEPKGYLSPLSRWRDYLRRELLQRFDDLVFAWNSSWITIEKLQLASRYMNHSANQWHFGISL